jgi:hypothetical protein
MTALTSPAGEKTCTAGAHGRRETPGSGSPEAQRVTRDGLRSVFAPTIEQTYASLPDDEPGRPA